LHSGIHHDFMGACKHYGTLMKCIKTLGVKDVFYAHWTCCYSIDSATCRSASHVLPPGAEEVYSQKSPCNWTVEDVAVWLKLYIALTDEEVAKFYKNHINGNALLELSDTMITKLGIESVGRRMTIVRGIKSLLPSSAANDNTILIAADSLQFERMLGHGFFGEVWKARWNKQVDVAVKFLKNSSSEVEFLSEVHILSKLRHPNVVQCYGIARDVKRGLLLVAELMDGGSVLEFLQQNPELSHVGRLGICQGICCGMSYLEIQGIVHRDLATRNVLIRKGLDETKLLVKLTDFGLGKSLYGDNVYIASQPKPLPVNWTAPESLKHGHFSSKSDVWAFGVTFWEIWSNGASPYGGTNITYKELKADHRLSRPTICLPSLWEQCAKPCFLFDPAYRPSFSELFDRLES
jgi:tRNA A-37 threonylcarbamoyl transferase component Bud32